MAPFCVYLSHSECVFNMHHAFTHGSVRVEINNDIHNDDIILQHRHIVKRHLAAACEV